MTSIRGMCRLVAVPVMLSSLPALAQMTAPGASSVGISPLPGSGVDKVSAETQVQTGVTREGNADALRRGETHSSGSANERMPAFWSSQLPASTAFCPWPRRFAVAQVNHKPGSGLETAGNLANVG
jgi:hypothetical protein